MKEQLKAISEKATNALKNVTAQSELEELRVAFGKKKESSPEYLNKWANFRQKSVPQWDSSPTR